MTSPSSPHPTKLKRGRYTLERLIGHGSQAQTYEARDHGTAHRPAPGDLAGEWERYVDRARRGEAPSPHARVAVKCFHVGRATAWKDVELAEREARTLASLEHPNLPRYVEHFEEEGALYLVMEMVDGESLAALRARGGVSSVSEVSRMLHDVGDALRYLHGRAPAVIHRDIKPGNVLRRPDGSYALVDFGAVRDRMKPEGGSTVVGTFGFMAPEQFQGRASPKSDLYGLAATALVMLTGVEPEELPHQGLGIDVARAVPSSTPAPLVRALTAMLAPDPDRRVSSIDEALAMLEGARARSAGPPSMRDAREEEERPRRASAREEKRRRRAEKRARKAEARGRRAPFVPRLVAKVGLLVAWLVVWLTVGVVVPLVLTLLSLVFGRSLRRAALACSRAARRAQAKLGQASDWLSGHRAQGEAAPPPRVRVRAAEERVRVAPAGDAERDDERAGEAEDELETRARPLTKQARAARRRA